jgi:Zn-dependent protease
MPAVLRHPFEAAPYIVRPLPLAPAPAVSESDLLLEKGLTEPERALIRELRPEAFVPFIVTGGTAALSVALYSALWGPAIAFGLVLGMWMHELGHRAALSRLGIGASPILFVPFVGAVQRLSAQPVNATAAAWMALAGPACGLLFAIACQVAHALHGDPTLRLLAVAHALLTLFDLLPFPPLDGGRIRSALALRFDRRVAFAYALLLTAPLALISR